MAQLVKNLPVMQETWVRSLGWEDPLEKGKAPHSRILAWRIPWTVWLQTVDMTFTHSLTFRNQETFPTVIPSDVPYIAAGRTELHARV